MSLINNYPAKVVCKEEIVVIVAHCRERRDGHDNDWVGIKKFLCDKSLVGCRGINHHRGMIGELLKL
ncbi:hypothetical protein FR483_n282R [Paramecium bursaria Chlorella virus FR483]|uniref:Uncharacterized protein n282R n=1 Tax=Paramecium bursaria Chlorella virus FR483 TaxID=399781 RepID=A7J6Y6_PBCVF|nr:hypothetical protein FR483_n282R [Paramecium bursaria Chlorella virus FR483]ABT15567.1 hypothetical protein FR483_n282R [Paramecium bursaria Chlorella virus FR483]